MRSYRQLAPITLLAVLALAGCASLDTDLANGGAAHPDEAASGSDFFDGAAALDTITSCSDVGSLVAPHIDGLALDPDSAVDEFGVYCVWGAPEGNTEASQIRSVEVTVSPTGHHDVPTASDLELGGLTVIPDPSIENLGGIAYTSTAETSVAAVIATAVRVPGLDLYINGGQWAKHPSLDAAAAIGVAKEILGV